MTQAKALKEEYEAKKAAPATALGDDDAAGPAEEQDAGQSSCAASYAAAPTADLARSPLLSALCSLLSPAVPPLPALSPSEYGHARPRHAARALGWSKPRAVVGFCGAAGDSTPLLFGSEEQSTIRPKEGRDTKLLESLYDKHDKLLQAKSPGDTLFTKKKTRAKMLAEYNHSTTGCKLQDNQFKAELKKIYTARSAAA